MHAHVPKAYGSWFVYLCMYVCNSDFSMHAWPLIKDQVPESVAQHSNIKLYDILNKGFVHYRVICSSQTPLWPHVPDSPSEAICSQQIGSIQLVQLLTAELCNKQVILAYCMVILVLFMLDLCIMLKAPCIYTQPYILWLICTIIFRTNPTPPSYLYFSYRHYNLPCPDDLHYSWSG